MAESDPRYEFRVWGDNLTELRARLELSAEPVKNENTETYFVSRMTERCNAKIRDDLMDIKVLIKEYRGLEQWQPVLKAAFPIDRLTITSQIFPSMGIQSPRLSKAQYEMSEFVKEVVEGEDRIVIVKLSKTRFRFKLEKCQAEFTEVHLDDATSHTVAMESSDPDKLIHELDEIGLKGKENVSYIRYLRGSIDAGKL